MSTDRFGPTSIGDRIAILNVVYPAMISIAQELRLTVERLTVGGCGLVLVVTGWLLSQQSAPPTGSRIFLTIGIVVFTAVSLSIVISLERRYRGVSQAIRNLNEAQLCHTPGAYLQERNLFPESWKQYGTHEWKEPIFRISYASMSIVGSICIAACWLLR